MARTDGFSLLEVVIAAALLGIVLLGVGSLFATARRNITEHGDYRQALTIAQSEIDAIARIPPGDARLRIAAGEIGRIGAGSLVREDAFGDPELTIQILGKPYTSDPNCAAFATCEGLYHRIEYQDDPNFDVDGQQKDYKKVTVAVVWPDPLNPGGEDDTGRLHRVELVTYAAK